jgi:hypothetical protein
MLGKMIVIFHVPVSEEVGYMYLTMTESFGKSCCLWVYDILECQNKVAR